MNNLIYFMQLELQSSASTELQEVILKKALDLHISSYDASYVALAEYLKISLYTTDEEFITKTKSNFVRHMSAYC